MTSQTMIIIVASLSFSSLWFFAILIFTDRWHHRVRLEREAVRKHEQMLLQRIQAPVAAVDQHVIETAQQQPQMTPRFDSDEDLHRLLGGDTIGFDPLGGSE